MSSRQPYRILACSPRKGGNTDSAARLFAEGIARNGRGTVAEIHYLREYRVLPCIDCNACGAYAARQSAAAGVLGERRFALEDLAAGPALIGKETPRPVPFGCPLTRKDDSAALLRLLAEAPGICLVSPVYFYHVPAQLKALLDRTQPFWRFAEAGIDLYAGLPRRRSFVMLAGARPRGRRLFEGSLLTLRCVFEGMNSDLAEPLTLYGLDGPGDIGAKSEAATRERIMAYGELAGSEYAGEAGA